MTTPLPWSDLPWSNPTHARNDCQGCRTRDADFEVTITEPMKMSPQLLCRGCFGPWSFGEMWAKDEPLEMTVDWAPGRLADDKKEN